MFVPEYTKECLKRGSGYDDEKDLFNDLWDHSVEIVTNKIYSERDIESFVLPSLLKRKGDYTEVTIYKQKKLKIYHQETFDLSTTFRENEKEKGNFDLNLCFQVAPGHASSCHFEDGLIDEVSKSKGWNFAKCSNKMNQKYDISGLKSIVVMPKDQIKEKYVEGQNLDELSNYLCIPVELNGVYKKKSDVKPHPKGCRCKKCTVKRKGSNVDEDSEEDEDEDDDEDESDSE